MCGISGYFGNRLLIDEKLSVILKHRGPDDRGSFYERLDDQSIFLMHNRLSIIDLSNAGHQPMWDSTNLVGIIFNGEIYNYQSLRSQYLHGIDFHSNTDTEVVLHLYLKMGVKFVHELDGDFAICIYDKRINKLLLFRDRFGVKPLYYFYNGMEFAFASELKIFFALGLNLELNKDNLNSYFVFKYLPKNKTLLNNVNKVGPGCALEFDLNNRSLDLCRYWDLSKKTEFLQLNFNDAKVMLREKLSRAINSQLMADVPIGNFLSGGIDSSIIAYYLKERTDIKHFTATKNANDLKEEGSSSDFYYASRLAVDWKLNLSPIPIGSDEANLEMIEKAMYYSDDLIADGSQIPTFLIAQQAHSDVTILLSGMGADEIFLGYGGHQLSYVTQFIDKSPKLLSNLMCQLFSSFNPGRGRLKPYKRVLKKFADNYTFASGHLKYGFFNVVGDFQSSAGIYNPGLENTLGIFNDYFANDDDVFENITRFERENFLVKNLHYVDKMTMANSIEARVPFLDRELVEFAYSLPLKYKLSKLGRTKHILKESYSGLLPDYILHRRKAGFGMPLRSILKKDEKLNNLLDRQFFNDFGGFNIPNIDRTILNHQTGVEDNSSIIYALISFQVWYKKFFG